MSSFVIAPGAQTDLESIDAFLSEESDNASDLITSELFSSFALLARSPGLGRRRPEWTAHPLRFWSVPAYPDYLVIYEDGAMPIRIARVLHRAMNVPVHL